MCCVQSHAALAHAHQLDTLNHTKVDYLKLFHYKIGFYFITMFFQE